jgi:autotransporter-associated beta strand protein
VVLCNAVKFSTSSGSVTSSVYLCGGTLAVGAGGITNNASGGIQNFYFDGGTLSNMNSGDFAMTLPSAMISSNGAVIDDGAAGRSIAISSVLKDVAGQAGKLVKKGAGTLMLSGACTYSGGTTVSNGTMKILSGGTITNSSMITLASSTTTADVRAVTFSLVNGLGGHGTVAGQVIANAGSGIYPGGSNVVGTLTLTNAASSTLTLTNNGTLYIDVTTNTSDQLVVKGGLDLGPNAALTISSLPKLNSTEPYPIISYTGTMTGHFSQTNGLTPGWHVVEDPANSRVVLYGRAPGFVLTIQ